MFGGLPGVTTRATPLLGVWERTGNSTFATKNLSWVFDAASSMLIGFVRARAEIIFSKEDAGSGTVRVEFLPCPSPIACPDPVASDAAWMPMPNLPPVLQGTATRLRVND